MHQRKALHLVLRIQGRAHCDLQSPAVQQAGQGIRMRVAFGILAGQHQVPVEAGQFLLDRPVGFLQEHQFQGQFRRGKVRSSQAQDSHGVGQRHAKAEIQQKPAEPGRHHMAPQRQLAVMAQAQG